MALSAMSCKTILAAAIALGCAGIGFSPLSAAKKMKPEELVNLHLDAIGPADARAGMKSRLFRGRRNMASLAGRTRPTARRRLRGFRRQLDQCAI